MQTPFQVDRFHINNQQGITPTGALFSGFSLEDQSKVVCLVLNELILSPEQLDELKRVTLILAQLGHENILRPLAWGRLPKDNSGRSYIVFPDFGRPLSAYENLKALTPPELLLILRDLLRALTFADGHEVHAHQSLRPDNIRISLESSEVKLGFFGWPTLALASELREVPEGAALLAYQLPEALDTLELPAAQYDLYSLGLVALELATARDVGSVLPMQNRIDAAAVRKHLSALEALPLPLQELLYKLLTPDPTQRYKDFKQALDDVTQLTGGDMPALRFNTFILDTLVNGRFKLKNEIAGARVSRVYSAVDTRGTEEQGDDTPCVVKLIDLRAHPELSGMFHTKFKQLASVSHEHLLQVYDVGVHFENGFIAMESGLQSLEELLIKRGTLPLPDAGRIAWQLCKALEGLQFSHIDYHGLIKPSNVFLSQDLRTIKLGDALIADSFLRAGNLNFIGAEYYCPEFIRNQDADIRSDIYNLGTLFFEMLVGHPPFCFKVEDEIVDEHLNLAAGMRVEPALISAEVKDIILRCLEKNPQLRYQSPAELREELTVLLGYDKKQQVEIPNLLFDFAELSMVGKNTREKGEETLAIRLPAVNNRARGAIALLIGHGKDLGDASKAAGGALKLLRELLFHPGQVSPELAKLQKTDPEEFLDIACTRLNERLYREAFGLGKTKYYGLSGLIGIIQENTLYLHRVGDAQFLLLARGAVIDLTEDKWTISDEVTLGNAEQALSSEVQDRLGFGEVFKAHRLKRRLRDGDQLLLHSRSLGKALSISEIKELVTSSSEPAQAVELVRNDTIRRRLEGTISCVLLSVGRVLAYAEENVSHTKKGLLARNFLSLGDTYLNDGKIDEAIEQYTQALEINPHFAIIHHQLGVAYMRKGLLSYATSCFDRALTLNAKLSSSYLEIAAIYRAQRRTREVLPLLRKAVAEGARDAELFAALGRELLLVRNYDEAILYCGYALELEPGHPQAYRDRVVAIKRRGALDTKLLKAFAGRPRLTEDRRTSIGFEAQVDEDEN